MLTLLSLMITVVVMLLGAALGAVVAIAGTYYGCVFYDWLRGESGGNGILTLAWVFLMVTVPVGFFYGSYLGLISGMAIAEEVKSSYLSE